jgi:hypothetical protein
MIFCGEPGHPPAGKVEKEQTTDENKPKVLVPYISPRFVS